MNDKKLNRSVESIAATIIHESVHVVNDSEQQYTFGYGNNSLANKENIAPYWIGDLALRMLSRNDVIAHMII